MSCALLDNSKLQYGFAQTTIKTEPSLLGPPQAVTGKPYAFKRKLVEETKGLTRTFNRAKHFYWNVAQLSTETRFVTDIKVNRLLSFAETSLAIKHPELIRYLPDDVDKEWMFQHQIISAADRTERFLVLVHDEVLKAARSEASKSTARIGDLEGFRVPEFMLQKMRIFFAELSTHSQTFVVHPVQTMTSGSHPPAETNSMAMSSNSYGGHRQTMGGGTLARTRSTLSSSHATLSALLSGGSVGQHSPAKTGLHTKPGLVLSKDAVTRSSTSLDKKDGI